MKNPATVFFLSLVGTSFLHAAIIVVDGSTVGGTTTVANLTVGTHVTAEPNATISNSGGNLLFTPGVGDTNTDWYVNFGTGSNPLNLNTSIYRYVQVDFLAAETGAVSSNWQMFHKDTIGSTIGPPTNSGQNIGTATLSLTDPFSVVVDLTSGGTGATAWDGTAEILRFDIFEGASANKGKTFTITQMTFGSVLVPESSSALLLGLGSLVLLRRRR